MNVPPCLCPGYDCVESFGPDEDYEGEEEVTYVTLEMGNVEPTLVPSSTSYRLIGLDTSTPYLQLQGTILKGRHDMLLGTELIFTDYKDSHDWKKRSVVHVANTEQRISFQEVTLMPKSTVRKGKASEAGSDVEGDSIRNSFEPLIDDRPLHIDRMTGLAKPIARGPKMKKTASRSRSYKDTATRPNSRRSTRETEKEKEVESVDIDTYTPATEGNDEHEGANMDDMYMDTE